MLLFKKESAHKGLQRAITVLGIAAILCYFSIGGLAFYGLYCLFSITHLGDWWLIVFYSIVGIGGASTISVIVLAFVHYFKDRKDKKNQQESQSTNS